MIPSMCPLCLAPGDALGLALFEMIQTSVDLGSPRTLAPVTVGLPGLKKGTQFTQCSLVRERSGKPERLSRDPDSTHTVAYLEHV